MRAKDGKTAVIPAEAEIQACQDGAARLLVPWDEYGAQAAMSPKRPLYMHCTPKRSFAAIYRVPIQRTSFHGETSGSGGQ